MAQSSKQKYWRDVVSEIKIVMNLEEKIDDSKLKQIT